MEKIQKTVLFTLHKPLTNPPVVQRWPVELLAFAGLSVTSAADRLEAAGKSYLREHR